MLSSLLRRNFIKILRMNYATEAKTVTCAAHMNELPVPCGPWAPWYAEKQSLYSKILLFGIASWVGALAVVIYTDSMFLNFFPPAQPGPPSDYVEECDDSEN